MCIERHKGTARLHHGQRGLIGRHDGVAANDQVGLGGVHLGGEDGLRGVGNLDVTPGGTALLRQASRVLGNHAFALQMGRHAQERANRNDTCTTHATHHNAPGVISRRQRWHRDLTKCVQLALLSLGRLLELSTLYGHEARAEAFNAAEILVATILVNGALAAKFGFQRFHAQAVGLHAAIAATFAYQLVDDDTLVRLDHGAALAATALLGGTGLVVNNGRGFP